MAEPAYNFTHDKFPRVRVLYDYEYEDDLKEQVHMHEGEIFYLLNTDGKDWWHVCRPDSPESPFYVPSSYVEILANISTSSRDGYSPVSNVDLSNNNGVSEKRLSDINIISGQVESRTIKQNMADDNEDYENIETNIIGQELKNNVGVSSFQFQHLGTNAKRPQDLEVEDDYVNLEDYRKDASITSKGSTIPSNDTNQTKSDFGDYANLDELRSQMQLPPQQEASPQLTQGRFVTALGGDWQQYEEIKTKRPFYHNAKTGECKWKPPKGDFHRQKERKRQAGSQSPTDSLSPESPDPEKTFFPSGNSAEQKFANLFAPQTRSHLRSNRSNNTCSMILENITVNGPSTDPIEGALNKCKILIGKKSAKKWSYNYAKLDGSNLVFYKDKKASLPTKQDPHGKIEQMVCLVNCSITKDSSDKTSKKNTIVLTNPEGHWLLQADNETLMQEWFIKIHTRIGELGGTPDTPDTVTSDSGTLERKGIKKSLESWISKRSDKKTLENKGIYKENLFGGEIKQICAKEKSRVPTFVTKCIEGIEKRGLEHEGIYRIAGSMSQIQKLRCTVDQGEQYNLDDQMWDVHVLCGTLKLFFRELKDPLFTYALFDKFLKGFLSDKAAERFKLIKSTMDELPRHNYDTIKVLFKHLCNVMDLQKENKMGAHQLAIVFGPTLIWPDPQTTSMNLATSMVYQSQIVEFVLLEYKNIFR